MSQTADLQKKSVTRDDAVATRGGLLQFVLPIAAPALVQIAPDPPAWWSPARDLALKQAYRACGLWETAVGIAMTRVAAQGYLLDGDVGVRVRRAREMVGRGWVDLISKLVRDFVTADNGAHMEIVRATKAYGSKVLGFQHLPSSRCVRTGDPETPLIYIDRMGRPHEMRAHQVVSFSDQPDPDLAGVGMCSTSRAYSDIYMYLSVKTFERERLTGRRPLHVDLINGVGDQRIEDAQVDAAMKADAIGLRQFGATAVSAYAKAEPITHVRIPMYELPPGYNPDKFVAETRVSFAAHLGMDATDLDPRLLGNRALGAGAQAQVLDDKQNAKGLIAFRQSFMHFMNDTEVWHPLPGGVTFGWSERDLGDQQAKAALSKLRAETRKVQIDSGEITAAQAAQMAVQAGDVPENFIAADETAQESLTDEDKSDTGISEPTADAAVVEAAPAPTVASLKSLHAALLAVAEKRMPAGATVLARYEPPAEPPPGVDSGRYWRAVTKAFDEIGSAWTAAAEPPQADGETKRSIGYTITNRNTHLVQLKLHAGNTERPEVAIRAVLFGRKGFGPKRAKVLRFRVGNETVFAKKVKGAAAQDWLSASLSRIRPQIVAAQKSLGALRTQMIAVSDVPGARRYNVAPPAPSDAALRRARGGKR